MTKSADPRLVCQKCIGPFQDKCVSSEYWPTMLIQVHYDQTTFEELKANFGTNMRKKWVCRELTRASASDRSYLMEWHWSGACTLYNPWNSGMVFNLVRPQSNPASTILRIHEATD